MSVRAAIEMAFRCHKGQVDKAGEPYIRHCLRVAGAVAARSDDPVLEEAAILHDVAEDCDILLDHLVEFGISDRAAELVDLLTKREGQDYAAYLARIKADPEAMLIKLCDIADNSDPVRLAKLDPGVAAKLSQKYNKAMEILAA
jgi:(p)ppGpp synthase/HD superfamily hydrolase